MNRHDGNGHVPEPDHRDRDPESHAASPSVWDADMAAAEALVRADRAVRSRPLSRRSFLTGAAAAIPGAVLLGSGVASARSSRRTTRTAPASLGRGGYGPAAACALPAEVLARIKHGWDPERSTELVFVPHGWNYISGGISHSTPWHYTQDVPMFWYGPGIINPVGSKGRFVNSSDIAPTVARLVKFPFDAPDGTVMTEAIKVGHPKPKLVVVLVWDAGGRYVLGLHPQATPHLKSLIPKGTWYANATCGSNPSNTAPIHATIGTGAHPVTHGIVDNTIRFDDGHLGDPWSRGPSVLKVPTLADEYAKAMGSKVRTAMFGTLSWHLGMVGQGAALPGGVKHIVVLRDQSNSSTEAPKWQIPAKLAPYYRFPTYVNDPNVVPPLSTYTKQYADAIDGKLDGTWRGHSIQAAQGGFHTPARVPFQTKAIERVIEHEQLGKHEEPDLLFINYKIIDEIGHEYFADSVEMDDTIRVQDQFLGSLVAYLDDRFPGQWALCLTADHGHTATPGRTGGAPLGVEQIHSRLEAHFDADGDGTTLTQDVRPVGTYLNTAELQQNKFHVVDLTKYLSNRTIADLTTPALVPPGKGGDAAFDAVFAGSIIPTLDCSG
jgi:Type I phosphodiesterase / nucleotide pyrophosphatase